MIKNISLEQQEGGANYRVKWQSHFSILRAPGALNTENTVLIISAMKKKEYIPYYLYLAPRALSKLQNDFAILPCN